jgi:hypothetical protein
MSDEPRSLAPSQRALAVACGLTREEVARLHRGELDADVITALVEVSAGLAAPAPPPEGDLVPNGTGWRLSQGNAAQRIHPRLWRWVFRMAWLGSFGPFWATLLGLPHSFIATLLLGVAPFGVLHTGTHLSARRALRTLERAPSPTRIVDAPSGSSVRLEGMVVSEATVPTLFRGIPAVLFKSRLGGAVQTQGIDFDLRLDGGERVRVSVRDALVGDRPERAPGPPACGPVKVVWGPERGQAQLASDIFAGPSLLGRLRDARRRYEAVIAPGDRIEVCGVLHHEPDPDARAPFSRQMPTRAVIRAGKLPLLVRRLG